MKGEKGPKSEKREKSNLVNNVTVSDQVDAIVTSMTACICYLSLYRLPKNDLEDELGLFLNFHCVKNYNLNDPAWNI